MNYWVAIYRFAWILMCVLCAVALLCVFVPKCRSLRALHDQNVRVEEENRRIEERIRTLRVKRERFASDPSFVERTARETGMVKPDETIFKFVSNAPVGAVTAP
jgi:cell division protein FtsB